MKLKNYFIFAIKYLNKKNNIMQGMRFFSYSLRMALTLHKPLFPLFAVIGVTDNCNLNCKMCPRLDPKIKKDGLSEMSLEHFKNIVDNMPYLYAITLLGMGEPLLHKDIFKMIDYAKRKNIEAYLYTNGMLLDNKEMAVKLISSGVDRLSFSVDGATAETVENIRIGVKFDVLLKNIQYIVRLKKEKKSPIQLSLKSILIRKNIDELPAIVELAYKLGIPEVGAQDIQYMYESGISTSEYALRTLNEEKKLVIRAIFKKAKSIAGKYGIKLTLPKLTQPKKWTSCHQPWHELLVTSKGFVVPCCVVHNIFLGNIFEENPLKIWNNEKNIDWRTRMRSNNPPQPCTNCNWF
jgi:radical SAM protein with 4Fe4S-binding SPASM domain